MSDTAQPSSIDTGLQCLLLMSRLHGVAADAPAQSIANPDGILKQSATASNGQTQPTEDVDWVARHNAIKSIAAYAIPVRARGLFDTQTREVNDTSWKVAA